MSNILFRSVWVQLLSRLQKHIAVVRIPLAYFQNEDQNTPSVGETPLLDVEILLEEHNDLWINICDIFKFICTPNTNYRQQRGRRRKDVETKFIWSSEMTGYRHLYLITKHLDEVQPHIQPITSGEWCVLDKPIKVDRQRKLVYFMGKKETPLESHLYVASYAKEHLSEKGSPINRLTELEFSHSIAMDKLCKTFVDTYSNMETAPMNVVRFICHHHNDILPLVQPGCYSLQPSIPCQNEDENQLSDVMKQFHDGPYLEAIPGPKVGYCHSRISTQEMLPEDSNPHKQAVIAELPTGQAFSFINSDGKYCEV